MYGKTFSALMVFLILAVGIGYFVWRASSEPLKQYKNSVYGYSLEYPSELDVKEYTDDIVVFGDVSGERVDAAVELRVVTAQGESGQTPQDAVADQLKNLCAADGPNASFSCTDTISTEPFATSLGEQGYVLMVKGELKNLTTGIAEVVPRGPYYVVSLAHSATISKVLVIMPPLNMSAAEADPVLIRHIAESVRIK